MTNIIYTTSAITEDAFDGFEVELYNPLTQEIIDEEIQGWLDNRWAYATEAEAIDALEDGQEVHSYTREEFTAWLAESLGVELVD